MIRCFGNIVEMLKVKNKKKGGGRISHDLFGFFF